MKTAIFLCSILLLPSKTYKIAYCKLFYHIEKYFSPINTRGVSRFCQLYN